MLRWLARIVSSIALVPIGIAMLGALLGGEFTPGALGRSEIAAMLCFAVLVLGMLLGWRHEGLGGALILAGLLGFHAVEIAASGRPPAGWAFKLLALPAALYLASWWWTRTHAAPRPPAH